MANSCGVATRICLCFILFFSIKSFIQYQIKKVQFILMEKRWNFPDKKYPHFLMQLKYQDMPTYLNIHTFYAKINKDDDRKITYQKLELYNDFHVLL